MVVLDSPDAPNKGPVLAPILMSFRTSCACSDAMVPDEDLELEPFLDAFEKLTIIFDTILPRALADTVRKEALSKLAALRYAALRYRKDDSSESSSSACGSDSDGCGKAASDSVRRLIAAEGSAPPGGYFTRATRAIPSLAWLARVLMFVEELISNLNKEPLGEPSAAAMMAYHHKPLWTSHSVVTRAVFERALAYLPTRQEFENSIESDTNGLIELEFYLSRHVSVLIRRLPEQAGMLSATQ